MRRNSSILPEILANTPDILMSDLKLLDSHFAVEIVRY